MHIVFPLLVTTPPLLLAYDLDKKKVSSIYLVFVLCKLTSITKLGSVYIHSRGVPF